MHTMLGNSSPTQIECGAKSLMLCDRHTSEAEQLVRVRYNKVSAHHRKRRRQYNSMSCLIGKFTFYTFFRLRFGSAIRNVRRIERRTTNTHVGTGENINNGHKYYNNHHHFAGAVVGAVTHILPLLSERMFSPHMLNRRSSVHCPHTLMRCSSKARARNHATVTAITKT